MTSELLDAHGHLRAMTAAEHAIGARIAGHHITGHHFAGPYIAGPYIDGAG